MALDEVDVGQRIRYLPQDFRARMAHVYDSQPTPRTVVIKDKKTYKTGQASDVTPEQIRMAIDGEDPFPQAMDVFVEPEPIGRHSKNDRRFHKKGDNKGYRNRARGRFR